MPAYELTIEKQRGTEFWTNVYNIVADDLATAATRGGVIVQLERAIHDTGVTFTAYRVSGVAPGDTEFQTVPLGSQGLATLGSDILPLWNVLRVDFGVAGRRALRKYLRLPLSEGTTANGFVNPDIMAAVANNYAEDLVALGYVVGPNGTPITSGVVKAAIAMRQLKRGSKRKITSGP